MVPFAIYAIIRTDLRGFDPYAFLSQSCGGFVVNGTPLLADLVTKAMPCNVLAIKGVLFLLFFASILGIACLGTLFNKEKGWLAGLFSFLSPLLFFEATKFENDAFAIPILIWSMFFFYKARQTRQKKYDVFAFFLVLFAGLFWYGSIYWLIAYSFSSFFFVVPAILAFLWLGVKIVAFAPPNNNVVEGYFGSGIAMVAALVFGFALIPAIMWPQTALFVALLVSQIKFAWFIVPILSVGTKLFYANKKLDGGSWSKTVKGIMLTASLCLVVVWGFALIGHPPYQHQWQAVDYAISQSENGFVQNDWDLGYWIYYKGGTPLAYGGGAQPAFGKGIVLTRKEIDCTLLKEFKEMKVYQC